MTELARGHGRFGTVSSFDGAVGLGTVESEHGESHRFHCIEIADGTREIDLGVRVSFDLLAKFGTFEAANIRPVAHDRA